MEVENGGLEDDFSLLSGAIFHFHDYGRKGTFLKRIPPFGILITSVFKLQIIFYFFNGRTWKVDFHRFVSMFPCVFVG